MRQSPSVCGRATSLQTDRRTFRARAQHSQLNIRHHGTMYAAANMVRARACGKLVLGDKANPQMTFHLNEGHVTDMCEIGGDLQSQRDVHCEVKEA